MAIVYEYTNDERELRKQEEITIVEQCIFPKIVKEMIELNLANRAKKDLNYEEAEETRTFIKRLDGYLNKKLSSSGDLQKKLRTQRLERVYTSVERFAAMNKYDTRKILLMSTELVPFLAENDVLTLDDDLVELFATIQEQVQKNSKYIDNFDKIEKSALKKCFKLLEAIQDTGYFRDRS